MSQTRTPSRTAPDRPTPRWWGPAVSGLLLVSTLWFFAYAVLAIPAQQSLGAWNYLIAFGITLVFVFMFRAWRGDPKDGWEPGPTYGQQIKENVVAAGQFFKKVFSRY